MILHALERDPRQRYSDATALKRHLENLDSVIVTHRAERLRTPSPWAGRRHIWLLIAGIVVLQAALFLGLYYLLQGAHHR